jgi:ATP/maltotriose-dependent transcriptional regulator MalT
VVVVEAAGGYGKTVLATELVDSWRAVGIEVRLDRPGVTAALLAGRLRSATARAGYTEAAAGAEGNREPADVVDNLLAGLARERCAIVIDDAHNAQRDAAQLVDYLAAQVSKEQRLVVLARCLPRGAERLRREENLHLDATDLRLSPEECMALCRTGFALTDSDEAIKALERATAGWTAATVLAAGRAARTKRPLSSITPSEGEKPDASTAIAVMLDEALGSLGPGARPLLGQLAHLPLLDEELVDQAVGQAGFFHRCTLAGLPFTPAREQWLELPGPVSEHLATFSLPDSEVVKRAARQYSLRGEIAAALELLLACKQPEEAAALLAGAPPMTTQHLDARELDAFFEQLTNEAVDAHPEVLLVVNRALRGATQYQKAAALLERAQGLAERTGDERLARAASAELAQDLLQQLRKEEAGAVARAVLSGAGVDEKLTRARAYHALGFALCGRVDAEGRPDEAALAEAEECFVKGSNLYRALGVRSLFSALAVFWAMGLEFPGGHAVAAMQRLDEALQLVSDNPRRWCYVMIFRTWVAADLGLDEVSKASAEEVLRLGEQLRSDIFLAHGHWK